MYCVNKRIVRGNQARVKNADLRHPSRTVVMQRRKFASPVRNVLKQSQSLEYPCLCSDLVGGRSVLDNRLGPGVNLGLGRLGSCLGR